MGPRPIPSVDVSVNADADVWYEWTLTLAIKVIIFHSVLKWVECSPVVIHLYLSYDIIQLK